MVLTCCCLNLVAVLPLLWLHHVSFSCGCSLVAFLQTTHHTQGRDTSSSLSFPSYVSFSENKFLNWCLQIKLKQRAILKEPVPKLSYLFECHGATKQIMDYFQRFNVAFGFLARVKDCWTLRYSTISQFRQTMIVTGVNSVLSWSECRVSYVSSGLPSFIILRPITDSLDNNNFTTVSILFSTYWKLGM